MRSSLFTTIIVCLSVLVSGLALSCAPEEDIKLSLDKTSFDLNVGETQEIRVTAVTTNRKSEARWSSSDNSVATISPIEGGVEVKGVSPGQAIITFQIGEVSASCSVTVKAIEVTDITLDTKTLSLTEGQTYRLSATVFPDNATDKTVTWSSSNPSVATVSNDGRVTAVKEGKATIYAQAGSNPGTRAGVKTATCAITVTPKTVAVTGISLNYSSISIREGQSWNLSATVTPSNATDKIVTWTSSNNLVATVSSSGTVTGVKAGTATITAKAGSKSVTCTVTVTAAVTGVSLNKSTLSLTVGNTETLTVTITPSNATNKNVTWSTSNTSVATVSSTGVVTAKAAGTATITVTTEDGSKTATCKVTVTEAAVAVTGVSLNKTTLSLTVGGTETLTATITPSNATNKNVTWSSNATTVATVSSSGVVTAKSVGMATIMVKTSDGAKTASCSVIVSEEKKTIHVSDAVFKSYLVQNFDVDKDGEISEYEASLIRNINISNKPIASIQGIENMPQLVTLECMNLELSGVDLSNNPRLEKIVLGNYTSVSTSHYNQLTSLDVSKNTSLKYLDCISNQLSSLDVSKNTLLVDLYCSDNQLVSLDMSKNIALKYLSCACNQLSSLDVSKNTVLQFLNCHSNHLTGLDVSENKQLSELHCFNNQITSIDISNNTALSFLYCSPMNNSNGKNTLLILWISSGQTIDKVTQNRDSNYIPSETIISIIDGRINGYTYVEMGDGLKWATMNVGATKPEEYGDYFAWGETSPKSNYDWSTYKYGTSSITLTKYVAGSNYGTVDNKTTLEASDDAATVNWGGSWRIPTDAEWTWLRENCTWTWTTNYNGTGVAGSIVTSNVSGYEGYQIFLPAAGDRSWASVRNAGTNGDYWSSSLYTSHSHHAYFVYFHSSSVAMSGDYRYYGRSVRPVSD